MGRIVVTTSGKGGVGKTTVTANLGTALAQAGQKVALMDADFGLRNLDLLLGLENRVVYTAVDVIAGACRLGQALVKDRRSPNLVLLPAAQARDKTAVTADQMGQLMRELAQEYDFVIVDCPAGIEQGFRNAIAAVEEAIVVTTPDISAVRDADRVIGILEASDIKDIRLIVNRVRPEMVAAENMMSVDDVVELLSIPLLAVVVDEPQVIVSTNKGEPMVLAESPSLAATAIIHAARRLLGEEVPWLDWQANSEGFFGRLKQILKTPIF